MRILGNTIFLLFLAGSAGMAAQEFVTTKLCAANDQMKVVSIASLKTWGTAEAYYAEGRLPRGAFARKETLVALVDRLPDDDPVNDPDLDHSPKASPIPEESPKTWPAMIAERETDVLAQIPTPPPVSTTKPGKPIVSEPDASTVQILPPPAKRMPSEHAMQDKPDHADYTRTPSDITPALTHPDTIPSLTEVAPGEPSHYLDAQELIRRRAVKKAEERRRRIEVRKWLGYSPLRPSISAMPSMGGDSAPTVILVPYVVRDDD